MKKLIIEGSKKTPAIDFDPGTGVLELYGRSIPENATAFYDPLIQWVRRYLETSPKTISLKVKLEYYNSSSYKCIRDIFYLLEEYFTSGHEVNVSWFHEPEDEDMLEAGQYYKDRLKLPIKLIAQEKLF